MIVGKSAIRLMKGDELIPEMNKRLKDVTEVLDIPASAAAVLLREHNWNKEVVMEVFYNDPDALLQKCGVYYRVHPNNKRKASTLSTCEICYDEDVDMLWYVLETHESHVV
jgi:ariadne-1